jgi:fatty acid desaturase
MTQHSWGTVEEGAQKPADRRVETRSDTMTARPLTISASGTFGDLSAQVEEAGLMAPRRNYYRANIALNLGLTAACWVALFMIGDSWWQLVTAVVLALIFLQSGNIAHDAGHRQITKSRSRIRLLGLFHMNLLIGTAFGWWENQHNRHHSNPNNLDRDPDTLRRQVIFHVDELAAKGTSRFRRFIIRFQSVMFFVLLGQEAWRLHAAGFRAARAGQLKAPATEIGLILLHAAIYLSTVFMVMSPGKAIVFILLSQAVFGVCLGALFAPNHKGMAVHRDDVNVDWLHRQVLTSRNIRSTRLTDFFYGGLNYQIEHHLFPAMPRVNLRSARPIVMRYCQAHGIPYHEVAVRQSYRDVARYLAEVSAQARQAGCLDPAQLDVGPAVTACLVSITTTRHDDER